MAIQLNIALTKAAAVLLGLLGASVVVRGPELAELATSLWDQDEPPATRRTEEEFTSQPGQTKPSVMTDQPDDFERPPELVDPYSDLSSRLIDTLLALDESRLPSQRYEASEAVKHLCVLKEDARTQEQFSLERAVDTELIARGLQSRCK
ncbi:hypothetical protein [Enhygromyxa salina]|uniref:hypothetical protein n=1 Tax=Enhygromyxa salina TaxID=215803 RepID=UPI000D0346A6|nr:hypothetical protein [Enhygromyxa salina]